MAWADLREKNPWDSCDFRYENHGVRMACCSDACSGLIIPDWVSWKKKKTWFWQSSKHLKINRNVTAVLWDLVKIKKINQSVFTQKDCSVWSDAHNLFGKTLTSVCRRTYRSKTIGVLPAIFRASQWSGVNYVQDRSGEEPVCYWYNHIPFKTPVCVSHSCDTVTSVPAAQPQYHSSNVYPGHVILIWS